MATISFKEICDNKCNMAPSQLSILDIPNKNSFFIHDLLDRELKFSDNGTEVGSINYINKSTHYFIKAKALQKDYFIPLFDGEATTTIRPQVFIDYKLKKGDCLISKDSNIGESVILDKDYPNHTISGALYKLPISKNKYYIFAFLKHRYFKKQLDLLVSKGSTIRHAKTLFLDCKIPFPNQKEGDKVIIFVELLTKAIINKEKEIRRKNKLILDEIQKELTENQKSKIFCYKYPQIQNLQKNSRIDAGFYCENFNALKFQIINYKNGYSNLDKQGLDLIPGSSLEIKLLGTRINSKTDKNGFYRLITPKQITRFGTILYYEYIGTSYSIPVLKKGDIVFGESGTGRSFVYMDNNTRTITNAHGHVLRPLNCTINKAITVRCILSYLKEKGFIDYMTVGGSGGHLSPSYFNRVVIPNFPEKKQEEIANFYHNPINYPKSLNLNNFLEEDNKWNKNVGIIELDDSAKNLKKHLVELLDKIVNDNEVKITFTF